MKQLSLALSLALATIAPFTGHADSLDGITIAPEVDAAYDREAMYGRWRDADNDGLNTRHEVLAMDTPAPRRRRPEAFVISKNLHRRNLTKGQRAMAVAKIYPDSEQGKRSTSSLREEVSVSAAHCPVLRPRPRRSERGIAGDDHRG